MQELESCPSCKGKCELKDTLHLAAKYPRWGEKPYYVECSVCHARSTYFVTKEEAIDYWNKRSSHRHKPIAGCPMCEEGSGMLLNQYHPLYKKPMVHIACDECGFKTGHFNTVDEAIDNWNGVKNDDKGPSD